MFKQTNSLGFLFVMLIYITACTPTNNQYKTVKLNNSWRIQSSEHVTAKGDEISNSEFDVSGWYKAEVPQTVLAAPLDCCRGANQHGMAFSDTGK